MPDLDLLVIGDLNPDLILCGGDLTPRYGKRQSLVERADLVAGGSAAITAIGAAKLGLRVGICGAVGDDATGRLMLSFLTEAGVDTRWVHTDPSMPTGISVILVRDDERAILTAAGTISALDGEGLRRLPDLPARHIHAANYYLMGEQFRASLPASFARFRAAGATTSIDTHWDFDEQWELDEMFENLDLFLPSKSELRSVTKRGSIDDAMADINSLGTDVVVKLGAKGGATLIDGEPFYVDAAKVDDIKDSVGAGGSFNAGYLSGMLTGKDAICSLRLAVAIGTLSLRGAGGTTGQPTMAEAEQLAF